MEITGKRQSKSYSIIRQLNRELENQGYYTIQGKVPKKYFFERIGG
nr:transcriptional regulator [Fusobacterium varium]